MPKKGAKKKDTSADREAEDARRTAEEEKVREEERQRKERAASEIKYKDQLQFYFHQEMPRLKSQLKDFASIMEKQAKQLEKDMQEKNVVTEWYRYLECTVLPSPKIERDLNTYLMLWGDEALQFDEVPSLTTMYSQLPNALNLLKQLEMERAELIDEGLNERASKIHGYMIDLIKILIKKWDHTTQEILQHVDLYPRESTENFQIEGEQDGFKFGLWANLTKNPRHKIVEFSNSNMSSTVAKPLALDNIGMRMIYCLEPSICAPFENQHGNEKMTHIGGILFFDLMELPETPKKVDKLIIRPIMATNGNIKKLEYPFKKSAEAEEEDQNAVQDTAIWLIQVNYVMQPNCVIDKAARIMCWDAQQNNWSKEGIRDEEVDHETGKVTFRTMKFGIYALCQNAFLELPYKNWEMNPTGPNECTLHISGQVNDIKILIKEGTCQLIGPLVEYHKSLQTPSPPSLFFKKLSQIGINFIAPKSMNGIDVGNWIVKHSKVEKLCIEGISSVSHRMAFKKNSANGQISFSKCAFQFRDVSKGDEWRSIIYNSDYKVGDEFIATAIIPKSNHIDDDTKLDLDVNENNSAHSTIYHALYSKYGPEETLISPSPLTQQTVAEVLQVTRVLAFA